MQDLWQGNEGCPDHDQQSPEASARHAVQPVQEQTHVSIVLTVKFFL